jgi:hypothetical protein
MKTTPYTPPRVIVANTKGNKTPKTMFSWWKETQNKDKAASQMLASATYLKENQAYRYDQTARFAKLYGNQSLFGFAGTSTNNLATSRGLPTERATFNLVQSVTDTLVSRIAQSRPQPVFLTDNGDYKQRLLSQKLNNFIIGEFYQTDTYEKATMALRDACVTGTGVLHTYETEDNKIGLERVLLTELLIDPNEAIYGEPRQIYRTKLVDREVLMAAFPKYRAKIELAVGATPDNSAEANRVISDLVMVVEGWHLRSGKNAKDGRHMLACSSGELLDEEYNKDFFPFTFLHYSPRLLGFWSQGVAEQLMGTQLELNALLRTISQSIKLVGVPRVFQEASSKVMSAAHNNEIGVIVKYSGTKPSYEVAPCNAPELYAERDKLIQYGYQQTGVSALQASSQKPQGLDSGEAIRTYDDISTDRFASLHRRYDNLFIDLAYQMIDKAKEIALREGKYSTVYPNKNGIKEIDFPKLALHMEDFVIQCYTQSSLPKDPAGRMAKVAEMVTSGMITIQEARRLMDFPDLEQVEKLANAGQERIYAYLDDIIESGLYTPPDPFMDLELAMTITRQYINLYMPAKLEESKVQKLRDFFSQCKAIADAATAPAMPQAASVTSAMPPAPIAPPPTQTGINSQVA